MPINLQSIKTSIQKHKLALNFYKIAHQMTKFILFLNNGFDTNYVIEKRHYCLIYL